MRCWIGVGEAADLLLQGVHQPAHAFLWRMAINKWAVLVWHARDSGEQPDRTSSTRDCWHQLQPGSVSDPGQLYSFQKVP